MVDPCHSASNSDYKLDNILVDTTDPATPIAVLDWDMATMEIH